MKAGKETEMYNQGYMDGYNDGENARIDPDYWTRLEHQAAIAAMQGMLSGGWSENIAKIVTSDGAHFDIIVHKANELAHALVEKMKQEREG